MLPTIAIRHPSDPNVRMLINAVDYREDEHAVWGEQEKATHNDLRVQKGARGLWFVKRGGAVVTHGFKTEAEADAAVVDLRE